ncbi:transposase-like protein [Corynebacterium diphtheriae C7 (beta)]|nr:transposase-like protein [Corynebacterium diphtheriae C7 (beta)]WJY88257.1 Integrase core domain protein [Corynebacterium diphtheriae]CAB0618846.1 IS3 family transposase ISAar40 [Corynebacterium diphtheriae]CAB1010097.1 IS3 family transposase ISAar40 [Corynebacterium diphtheriae]CAB1052136.1 IS3 family transposase ISAar40 [Corynebacterium diphtheriae]
MPLPDHFKPQDRGQKNAFDGVGGDLAANVRPGEGWLYLCVVRDGHSRRVLGWAMDSVHNTVLVERALRMAYTLRSGGADVWSSTLTAARSLRVGRTEVCFDNAMAESFWSTLKTEFYNRRRFATRDEAKRPWPGGSK